MRWSLFLSAVVAFQAALSFFCVALPVPSSWDELERREPARISASAKASSRVYRKNALSHPYEYHVSPNGVQRVRTKNIPAKMSKKSDADHIFEHQIYQNVLNKHGLTHKKLDPVLQQKSKKIINRPRNMAMIPAGINRGKGSVVRHGLAGKAITDKKHRDTYITRSYPEAKRTARKLDKAFEKHSPGQLRPGDNFSSTLRKTMESARILHPNQPSPAGTLSSSSGSSGSPSSGGGSPPSKKPGPPVSPSPAQGSVRARTKGKK